MSTAPPSDCSDSPAPAGTRSALGALAQRLGPGLERLANRLRAIAAWLTAPIPEHRTGTWLFLRLLGLCHVLAFASFDPQLEGLIGERGILPVQPWLSSLEPPLGFSRLWKAPTLFWMNASDGMLHAGCRVGMLLGVLLCAGVAVRPCVIALWALYLSVVTAGTLFMGYQWDALLVEATFLAIFLAPRDWKPAGPWSQTGPSRIALWALGWLLFRLMFLSGAVKLLSEDKLWRGLTALAVHYQTQPLPTPLAWWANHLPQGFHVFCCGAMFVVELLFPWLLLTGRIGRRVAAAAFVTLMAGIALTGNYCFFNLLVAALCLPVVDDRFWKPLQGWLPGSLHAAARTSCTPNRETPHAPAPGAGGLASLRQFAGYGSLGLLLFVGWASCVQTGIQLFRWRAVPRWAAYPLELCAPFRITNAYGLFAVMTDRRLEIVLQGSEDGKTWKDYEFRWKAGDPAKAPRFVAPYQPRLDWQMWFASLGQLRNNPWFSNFMLRVLQAEPGVMSLLEHNPFPEKPPRLLRAVLFQYRFTSPETREETGHWWQRDDRGDYCPPVTLTPPK